MKTTTTDNKSSPGNSVKPFFSKNGEGSFFTAGKEEGASFFQAQYIQRDLAMGAPNDPYEQEADKIGRQVMDNFGELTSIQAKLSNLGIQSSLIQPMPISTRISRMVQHRQNIIQSKCEGCEEEETMSKSTTSGIQYAGPGGTVSSAIEQRINSQRGGGQAIDAETKMAMESSFGADFGGVKIHTGTEAAQMSQELNAHAFTVGNDIFFNSGMYQPRTREGAGLLAHELTHTVQQGGAVQNKGINRRPLSSMLSRHSMAHLSSMDAETLSPKEMAQLQSIPEEELMQTKEKLESKEVDKVQKKNSGLSLRRCPQRTNRRARLKSAPTYSPSGALNATTTTTKKSATFNMAAEFDHDPSNGIYASCGEIRQYLKWSSDSVHPERFNHTGFMPKSSYPSNSTYEDRDQSNKRYGHRSGSYSDPQSFDEYLNSAGKRDQANGAKYQGSDSPYVQGSASFITSWVGTWEFTLKAIDTCTGNKELGSDSVTITW